jgi:hypothetical protein
MLTACGVLPSGNFWMGDMDTRPCIPKRRGQAERQYIKQDNARLVNLLHGYRVNAENVGARWQSLKSSALDGNTILRKVQNQMGFIATTPKRITRYHKIAANPSTTSCHKKRTQTNHSRPPRSTTRLPYILSTAPRPKHHLYSSLHAPPRISSVFVRSQDRSSTVHVA